jgi:probable rRNA maturation factor
MSDHFDCQLEISYRVPAADDRARYEQAAAWVARRYGISSLQVSIAIVDDPTIHALNREHLDHDWPTDVISFVFESDDETGRVEGEIIASVDTAARLAPAAGWRAEDELLLYVVHGLLHLAGLDDIEPEDQAEMRAAERDCLTELGVAGAERHLDRWHDVSY